MPRARPIVFLISRSILVLVSLTLSLSACGLGMDSQERLERAQEAFDNGEYRAAIIDTKNVLLDEPENIAARLLLGRASVEVGDGVSAEKELRRAVELGVDFGDIVADLGRALLQQGKFDEVLAEVDPELATTEAGRLTAMRSRGEAYVGLDQPVAARELFTEILSIDAGDIDAQLGVVQTYVVERNYMQARETLNQVLVADPDHIPSWLASGALSLRTGNADRAVSDYTNAVNLSRDSESSLREMYALTGLTDALLLQGSADEARVQLARMQELEPDDTRTLLMAARVAAIDRDWTRAQELLQEILRRAPEFRQAQMLLGYVHKESGNLGQAEMYLSAVVSAVPENADARKMLAETRLQMNRAEEARRALDPLLATPDADIGSLAMAAGASLALGEYDAATDLMERAVAADPGNVELRIRLALAYFRASDPVKAQEVLEAIPEDAEGNEFRRDTMLVLMKMAQGHREEALADVESMLQRWPDRAEAHNLVGSMKMSSGDYVAARAHFEAASELEDGKSTSIRFLAQIDELEGDLDSAADRYARILELQPNDGMAMVALAKLAFREQDYDGAGDWLMRASEAAPKSVVPRQMLATLYIGLREFEEAEKVLSEALGLQPDNADLLSLMGRAQLGQNESRGAESSFERAVQIDPDEPSHRVNLARARAVAGDKAAAIATLEEDLERTMQHLPSAVYLAALKADSGDIDGALELSGQLKSRYPDSSAPWALEAELLASSGKLIEAASAYEEAMKIEASQRHAIRAYQIRVRAGVGDPTRPLEMYLDGRPNDGVVRVYLAQAYQNLDQLGKANREYERVLQTQPDNFIAANNLAWNYSLSGDPRAEEVARRAYALQPENSAVVDTLGWIMVNNGKTQDGIALLRTAVELSEGRPDIRYHLAAALAKSGDVAEAKRILEEVLSADNTFASREEAEALLATL